MRLNLSNQSTHPPNVSKMAQKTNTLLKNEGSRKGGEVCWIEGIPSANAVRAHESDHPRPDGIRLGRINVDRGEGSSFKVDTLQCDDCSFGSWLCYHHASRLEPWTSIVWLKEVNGEVLIASGFTSWHPLAETQWAAQCKYYPVGIDGLPVGFK